MHLQGVGRTQSPQRAGRPTQSSIRGLACTVDTQWSFTVAELQRMPNLDLIVCLPSWSTKCLPSAFVPRKQHVQALAVANLLIHVERRMCTYISDPNETLKLLKCGFAAMSALSVA